MELTQSARPAKVATLMQTLRAFAVPRGSTSRGTKLTAALMQMVNKSTAESWDLANMKIAARDARHHWVFRDDSVDMSVYGVGMDW